MKKRIKSKQKRTFSQKILRLFTIFLVVIFSIFAILPISMSLFLKNHFSKQDPGITLFLGVDGSINRKNNGYRNGGNPKSDSIQVIATNPGDFNAAIMSIPRDSYVNVTCSSSKNKINTAFEKGGINCAKQTISNLIELPIDNYIVSDISSSVDFINDLDGIKIKSNSTFCEQDSLDNQGKNCFEKDKTYNMSGEEAISYARHRKTDNAFKREERQQQVIMAIFKELTLLGITMQFNKIERALNNLETSLSFDEMLTLGATVLLDQFIIYDGFMKNYGLSGHSGGTIGRVKNIVTLEPENNVKEIKYLKDLVNK